MLTLTPLITTIFRFMSNFATPEVVDRGSKTQLQVDEKRCSNVAFQDLIVRRK